jgi:hypothetical protein
MSKGKVSYLLFGATTGALLGFIFRNKISAYAGCMLDMVKEKANGALQSTSDLSNKANNSVQETINNIKSKVDHTSI